MFSGIFLSLLTSTLVFAHPGEDHDHIKREADELSFFAKRDVSLLNGCMDSEAARAIQQESLLRRAATAQALLKKRGLDDSLSLLRRDLPSLNALEAKNHNYTGVITSNDPAVLFSANTSCILSPEVTIGPYYVYGEMVRKNITETQAGVPMHLEIQFINVKNCKPVENLLVDVWHANGTGTYSGVAREGGLNTTWLRGAQQSSKSGVVEFDSPFPGHYRGRATHTHIAVQTGATLLANGSYAGGKFSHVGQIFYAEKLIEAVSLNAPYNTNKVRRMKNNQDGIARTQASNNHDPFAQFIYLNPSNINDGILAWIQIGIDPTADHTAQASWAAVLAADGGHAVSGGKGKFGKKRKSATSKKTSAAGKKARK